MRTCTRRNRTIVLKTSGEYVSSSEVIRETLRDWKQKPLQQLQNIDEVQRL
ncbi:MAG: hypothetical protein KME64_13180 [Scytonematopsis contorta HA4267-MV1]|jgi:Arc/MetJ-type ribon-helix-helix transcriptional regulator|nr:hypothetical protein [Scytonematopsis contorta HA4267-MV1]